MDYCRNDLIQISKSAQRILATLERVGGFASAQEVHRMMVREGEKIGLTTIYRGLQSLVDEKLIDLMRRGDGEAIYRLCGDTHHHHLICRSCGRTEEIASATIEKWAASEGILRGFRDVGHSVELFGLCSNC